MKNYKIGLRDLGLNSINEVIDFLENYYIERDISKLDYKNQEIILKEVGKIELIDFLQKMRKEIIQDERKT